MEFESFNQVAERFRFEGRDVRIANFPAQSFIQIKGKKENEKKDDEISDMKSSCSMLLTRRSRNHRR